MLFSSKALSEYGLGLGCNTMEGREQKYQCIAKYAENSTHQNRWDYIFLHKFMQLVQRMATISGNTEKQNKGTGVVVQKTPKR